LCPALQPNPPKKQVLEASLTNQKQPKTTTNQPKNQTTNIHSRLYQFPQPNQPNNHSQPHQPTQPTQNQALEASLTKQKALGLEDSDVDDVRRLVTDTNVYLLGALSLFLFFFKSKNLCGSRNAHAQTNQCFLPCNQQTQPAITILASVLHLLFEFLAFQSDIAFWRKNKSLRGLSVRSVVVEFFCQVCGTDRTHQWMGVVTHAPQEPTDKTKF
jgi:hypothetical protein